MRAWPAALLVTYVIGCGTQAQTGHDASTRDDARGFADAAPPDANNSFAVQYTDPDHGPFAGGTKTTIRGVGFAADDEVRIGGRLATNVKRLDPKHLEVVSPPGDPGAQPIEVRHKDGTTAMRADGFTYEAIAISPPSGSVAGGTYVAITGFGTAFDATTLVTFDGVPATGIVVENAERITCFTPPGTAGDANVVVVTSANVYRADRGYAYYATGDPFAGGLSGGPINGTLNVVVIDAYTDDGVPNAFVAIGDPATTPYKGYTDLLGQITFSAPGLHGPVDVVVAPDNYEVGTFDCFDATNLTIAVRPIISPTPTGPPGIGTDDGTIRGSIVFGDDTGLGSPFWSIVPQPRTATEVKRVYVTTAASSVFGGPRSAGPPIDYHYDPNQLAWPFEIKASPGARAVIAVAGLYDSAKDPQGLGAPGFQPFAIGVARGVLVGPMETVQGVDVVVNIPLDAAMKVDLVDPPDINVDPTGPMQRQIQAVVDMGGEGTIEFGAHGLGPQPGGDWPGTFTLAPDQTSITLENAPSLIRAIGDGSYSFLALISTYGGAPMSGRIWRGVKDTSQPIEISGFVGIPRPTDPAPEGTASRRHAVFTPEHETLAPTFHLHYVSDDQGQPVWRGVSCGAETDVTLPDLSTIGRVWPPPDTRLFWSVWSIASQTDDFNQYTYRWNSSSYWRAYANDYAWVKWPSQ
ncbi:MAG TPA: IPT/TIG domain-containing protein [Kofleriaceae bacterium]|nr:IPT/TIG domain-containing protein [Kofleriaceae bacterium]